MGAEQALDHPSVRVEDDVHRAAEAAHRRNLVDVGPHRARVGAVVRLRRRNERAVVRLDRLVGDDAGQDQLAAAARAPVVRLRLADRELDLALRHLVVEPDRGAARRHADVRVCVGVAGLVLEERDAEPLHPSQVVAAELLLDVGLRHRKHLPVRADDAGIRDACRLDCVQHGGEELRRRRGAELVVDDHRHAAAHRRAAPRSAARDGALERLLAPLRSRRRPASGSSG